MFHNTTQESVMADPRPTRLTILEILPGNGQGKIAHCVCACGNEHSALLKHVMNKSVRSCGCLRRELAGSRNAREVAEREMMAGQREAFHRLVSWPPPHLLPAANSCH